MTSYELLGIILALGVIGTAYSVIITLRTRPSGAMPKPMRGFFRWPATLSASLLILIIGITIISGFPYLNYLFHILVSLALGWVLLALVFQVSRLAGRKLAADGSDMGQIRMAYDLLSASGLIVCSIALLGLGLMVLASPTWMALKVEPLMAIALGCWLAVTFWSFPSALYRWLLTRESSFGPIQTAPLYVQFRATPGEMAFVIMAALACAIAIAGFRYPEDHLAGRLYPLGALAGSLVFGALVSPLLKPCHLQRPGCYAGMAVRWFGIGVFLIGTGTTAYILAVHTLGNVNAFYSFGVGLSAAMLLMLSVKYRPPFVRVGSPFGLEIAIFQALMLLAAVMLAFQWMAGYGVALCTVGMLSSYGVLFSLGTLWAARRTNDDSDADLSFAVHAASRFAEIVTAGAGFVLLVALIRLFTERAALGGTGIDIAHPYPLIGLVIGGSFPIALRALSQSGPMKDHPMLLRASNLPNLGRWAAFRTLGIWMLACVTPLVVAFFGRIEAAGAFLVGLAAAELYLIVTLWLGEVRDTADEGMRLATRSTHVLALGTGIVTVLFVPPLINLTAEVTREARILGLAGLFVVFSAWMLVVIRQRLQAEKDRADALDD